MAFLKLLAWEWEESGFPVCIGEHDFGGIQNLPFHLQGGI